MKSKANYYCAIETLSQIVENANVSGQEGLYQAVSALSQEDKPALMSEAKRSREADNASGLSDSS